MGAKASKACPPSDLKAKRSRQTITLKSMHGTHPAFIQMSALRLGVRKRKLASISGPCHRLTTVSKLNLDRRTEAWDATPVISAAEWMGSLGSKHIGEACRRLQSGGCLWSMR